MKPGPKPGLAAVAVVAAVAQERGAYPPRKDRFSVRMFKCSFPKGEV